MNMLISRQTTCEPSIFPVILQGGLKFMLAYYPYAYFMTIKPTSIGAVLTKLP